MASLFDIRKTDINFYNARIKDFLPDKIIDIHAHVWLKEHRGLRMAEDGSKKQRMAAWPDLIAAENSIDDLSETYRLLFPGKEVTPLIFSNISRDDDIDIANSYIRECSALYRCHSADRNLLPVKCASSESLPSFGRSLLPGGSPLPECSSLPGVSALPEGCPSLIFAAPWWSAAELEQKIRDGGFLGCKVYLSMADPEIAADDIRIHDFLPPSHLEVLDRNGWIAMLHIPGSGRLKSPANLEQMLEIDSRYPRAKIIIAHVGRAYCAEDTGSAFEILAGTQNLLFDFSANTNSYVFEKLIEAVGPKRILFGSDLPILRMRARRICEGGNYVNIVPKGMYGGISGDRHMREAEGEEAERLTFLLYEEIDAFRRAAEAKHLTHGNIDDIFYGNAAEIFKELIMN